MNKDTIFACVIAIAMLTIAQPSVAYPKTDKDFSLLPPYCKARFRKTSEADQKAWAKKIGRIAWNNIHHYCAGLDYLNKARFASDKKKNIMFLNKAIGEFDYMQKRAGAKFILQPEIAVNKGRAHLQLLQFGEALQEFHRAIKKYPKYVPAYTELSDYYLEQGDKDEARAILEKGLKMVPDSKSLKRRMDKL